MTLRFAILKEIMLGFLTPQDSYDLFVKPGDGTLEFDGSDIVLVSPSGERRTSHTVNHALTLWTEDGSIRPLS